MPIDFLEWIKLSDALLRAKEVLGDWEVAGRAMRFNLEHTKVHALCETFSCWRFDQEHDQEIEHSNKWCAIGSEFWPGSTIDWGQDFAALLGKDGSQHKNIDPNCRYFVSGIMVRRTDIDKIWPASFVSNDNSALRGSVSLAEVKRILTEIATKDLTDIQLNQKVCERLGVSRFSRKIWRTAKDELKKENSGIAARLRDKGDNFRTIKRKPAV